MMIRQIRKALMALVILSTPAAAQTTGDTLRTELVRTCGFAKASATQLTKAVAADSLTQDAQMTELIRSRGFARGAITQCEKSLAILDRIVDAPPPPIGEPEPPAIVPSQRLLGARACDASGVAFNPLDGRTLTAADDCLRVRAQEYMASDSSRYTNIDQALYTVAHFYINRTPDGEPDQVAENAHITLEPATLGVGTHTLTFVLQLTNGTREAGSATFTVATAPQPPPVEEPPVVVPPPVDPPQPEPGDPPPAGDGVAELPRVWVDTDEPVQTGRVVFVPTGGDVQAAIDNASRGDVIELQAGATYEGHFTLPAKSGTGWVVIRTRTELPPTGTRMTPTLAANARLAKIVGTRVDQRVLTVSSGASHYRVVGIELTYGGTFTGTSAIVSVLTGSRHILLDRVYVHGRDNLNLQRCVMLHAEHGAVIDSWLSKCHYKGQDSQAIIAWATNGPLKIVNNHLEGAAENVMFGGATPPANTIPSDIEIRRNHFYKPESWRLPDGSSKWTVKNLFEIKFARRVLLEGNVFEGNWRDGQDGHAFNIKLSSLGDATVVEDVTIRYNILRRTLHGLKIVSPANRVVIEHNLLEADDRAFTLLYGIRSVHLLNNTFMHGGTIILSQTNVGNPASGFVARGNIWGSTGGYGVKGGGTEGTSTLNNDFTGYVYVNNGHIGRTASRYPPGNLFVPSREAAMLGPLYRPLPGSPFVGIGADIDAILAATAGVVQ